MPADAVRPRIAIVRDPDDPPDTTKLLDRGVLVVRPAPGTTGLPDLALAVLAAHGKRLDTRPREHPRHWWDLARAWTAGFQVDHLVVDRAHTRADAGGLCRHRYVQHARVLCAGILYHDMVLRPDVVLVDVADPRPGQRLLPTPQQ